MARQTAYDKLRAEVARWEFPFLEFHAPPPTGPAKELGQMMLVVEARCRGDVVQRYGITAHTVLTAEFLDEAVKDILTGMVLSWAESRLKRTETTPPVHENEEEKDNDE